MQEANRTVHRTGHLADGFYDIRIGQNSSLHSLDRILSVANLQLVDQEIPILETGLDKVSAALDVLRT